MNMGYSFDIAKVQLSGVGACIEFIDIQNKMVAVGYHNGESLLDIYDINTLEQLFSLDVSFVQCHALKFHKNSEYLYLLAEPDGRETVLARIKIGYQELEIIHRYPGGRGFFDLFLDENKDFLLVIGNEIELWNLNNLQCESRIEFNDGRPKIAVILSNSDKVLVEGVEESKLYSYSLSALELESEIDIPFRKCKQMIVSPDQKNLIISKPGMGGSAMYDMLAFGRVFPETFNEDTVKTHFLFTNDPNVVIKVGKALSGLVDLRYTQTIRSPKYDAGTIHASSFCGFGAVNCFCFIDEYRQLFRIKYNEV